MKRQWHGFLAGVLVTLTCIGTLSTAVAASYQKQATLHYTDIKLTLDGKTVTPKDANGAPVEPFAINGTTYLPVRGVASALGLGVGWDQNTNTVLLTSDGSTPAPAPAPTPAPTPTPAPSVRFYPNSVVPMLENVTGAAYNDSYSKDGVSVMYIYPLTSLPSDSGFFDTYDALLTQHGFVMIGDSSSDDLIYRNASQKQGLVISIMAETGAPPALVVFVTHDA